MKRVIFVVCLLLASNTRMSGMASKKKKKFQVRPAISVMDGCFIFESKQSEANNSNQRLFSIMLASVSHYILKVRSKGNPPQSR